MLALTGLRDAGVTKRARQRPVTHRFDYDSNKTKKYQY
jgi:hypothetical protein